MSHLDELERAALLHGGPHLDVYADALQIAGDVRGEIIALDRRLERTPDDAALVAARRDRVRAWIGDLADLDEVRCRNGFLTVSIVPETAPELLTELVARGLDAYVTELGFAGLTVARAYRDLDVIAAHTWPRLTSFLLHDDFGDDRSAADQLARALRAMPRLRDLMLWVPAPIAHLTELRELALLGDDTDLDVLGAGPFPVTKLSTTALDVPAARWPALRTLDLSGNLADGLPAYAALERLDALPQLHELRLPDLTTPVAQLQLQRALDRMPQLVRLSIRRLQLAACKLQHPTAELDIPPSTPWPWTTRYRSLQFDVPRRMLRRRVRVAVQPALEGLARCGSTMSLATRDAWRVLWERVDDAPAQLPVHALRALFADDVDWWPELRAALDTGSQREATIAVVI